jgi:hypothetical protein
VSEAETACSPSAEQAEARKLERARTEAREAEARRDAYFASGTDEGGRSARASSDARSYDPSNNDDPKLKASLRTAAIDSPLQDDVVGNAIVAAASGGLAAGVRAVAVQRPAAALGIAATKTVKSLAGKALISTFHTGPEVAKPRASVEKTETSHGPAVPGGWTGPRGTSEVAPEPKASEAPPRPLGPVMVRG